MRRMPVRALLFAMVAALCIAGTATAKPPPQVLSADICHNSASGYQVFWIRYSYSGFKHLQAVGYSMESSGAVLEAKWGLAPDPETGSGVMAFDWGGVVVGNQATAMRATLYASSPNKTVGESAWIPISDNGIGGLSNNGWPAC